ncbi:MAG: acetyl-CoA carboxylase carboxyltransferase subunit beta [Thermomicrobiales bacterium]
MRSILQRGDKFQPLPTDDGRLDQKMPGDLWRKCPWCARLIYTRELENNLRVCPKCGHHFRLRARERIDQLVDPQSFVEWDTEVRPADPPRLHRSSDLFGQTRIDPAKSGEYEALITGQGSVNGRPIVLAVSDFRFSAPAWVLFRRNGPGDRRCSESGTPLLSVNASGGARMHEGLFSLMQMAKTVAAFAPPWRSARATYFAPRRSLLWRRHRQLRHHRRCHRNRVRWWALGPRVIEQITKQKLPEGFQTAEFLLEHGMIDFIVERGDLKRTITDLLDHYAHVHQVNRGESIPWQPDPSPRSRANGASKTARTGKRS